MFNNASNIDASHSTFSEVHRDQHFYSRTQVQGDYKVNTIVHGNQIFQGTLGLENLYRASVQSAAFDSIDRHPSPTCLPGTRLELFARIVEWIDNPNGNQPMFWLNGPAGSGKSAVAQSIAEKYASQHRLAASFFFSRKEILRRKPQGFFPTLACQMLVFAPSMKPAILDTLEADPTIPTKVLLEQARRLLQAPILSSRASFSDPALLVIDSLDECDDSKMASEIIHLLGGILRSCRWPLKILFTSRPESHIVQTFQHPDLRSVTCSIQLQDFSVDDDIRTYLHHSFKGIQESMNTFAMSTYSLPWPSEDDIELIVQKSSGLFIFAATVMKYVGIEYGSPVTQLQAVLRVLQNGAGAESALVHSPLDALYLDVLRTIHDEENVRTILGSIVFAFQPLSIRGLDDLLRKFGLDASYLVKSLFSVLVISGSDTQSDGAVHIFHTSFRDFLTSSQRSCQYFVDPVVFHSILVRACLELMSQHLRYDMCNLGDPSILNCEVEDLDKRCKLRIREGVRYACRWFSYHLSQIPWNRVADDSLILSLQDFANRNLLNWIEVLSLTGELDSAVLSLRETTGWLKNPSEEILALFLDTERMLLLCYDSIQQAALQVYYSLPFSPMGIQIRTTYARELKNKFVITHGLDNQWNPCLRCVSTGAAINSLAISASGRLIASAGDTPGVQLWDTLTGNSIGHFRGEGASSCPVIFSPSGDHVAVGYCTGGIDVWDVSTGHRVLDPSNNPHNTSVTALVFSRNGLFVASGAADASVHIWDVSNKTLKHSVTYHRSAITCLLFSFNDGLLASCSEDTSIITSSVQTGQLVRRFKAHTSKVNSISFSPDSETIASGSDDRSLRLWDTRTGVCLRIFDGVHKKPIRQVWITGDNNHVLSVCDLDVYMWKISGSSTRKLPYHIWSVNHFYKKACTMFPAWYAKIMKIIPASLIGRLVESDDGAVPYVAPSADGKSLGCAYGIVVFYLDYSAPQSSWSKLRHPLATPSTLDEPPLSAEESDNHTTAIAMALDKTLLVTSDSSGAIRLWNTSPRGDWRNFHNKFKGAVEGFWPTLNGQSLVVKPMVGLRLVRSSGSLVKDLETGGDGLSSVGGVPSPDSRYFAYWAEYVWNVDKSFSIYIYDAFTGARLKRIPGFFNITCGSFSVESDLFACAHGEGVIQVWELPSALCKTTIATGHAAVTALAFVPGNATLVMGSDQGYVEIRTLDDGAIVHRIESSPSKVLALAVPSEAFIVIFGHEDGSLFVWDPSYANVAPHCLSSKQVISEGGDSDPDGIDFIKFTEGHRSICTRSLKGVVCTWDLTQCLSSGYAEQAKETSVEIGIDVISSTLNTLTVNKPSESSEESGDQTSNVQLGSHDGGIIAPNSDSVEITSQSETTQPNESFKLEQETQTRVTAEDNTSSNLPGTSPPSSQPSCPSCLHHHLISRSESDVVYDRYLRSNYSVNVREGWVYRGSKRMIWLPNNFRPSSPTRLAAYGDQLVILVGSKELVFLDLRPMINESHVIEAT